MSQNKEIVRLEAWSAPRLPLQSLCLSSDLLFYMLLFSHIIKLQEKLIAESLLKPQTYFNLIQKLRRAKNKKKRKHLLVKKQKWEERFTDILD